MEEPVYVLNDGNRTVIPLVKEIGRRDVGGNQRGTRWLRIERRLKGKTESGDWCLAVAEIGNGERKGYEIGLPWR